MVAAKEALRAAKAASRDADVAATRPAVAAKVYALADDLRGEDGDALADLTAAGFPARAVLNVARARLAETDPGDDDPEADPETTPEETAPEETAPEEDDPYPPFCDALLTSHAAAATARDFAHPSRGVAVVPVSFPRDEDTPDATALASLVADACGALAASDACRTSRGANPPPSFACRTPPA